MSGVFNTFEGLGNEFEAFWALMLLLGCLKRSWGCLGEGLGGVLGRLGDVLGPPEASGKRKDRPLHDSGP